MKKIERYRKELCEAGMKEPVCLQQPSCQFRFYAEITPLTAFIVNLHETDDAVEIVYGYASTAFTRIPGDEKTLIKYGIPDENITIHEKICIQTEMDEENAKRKVLQMYRQFQHASKEELLICAQEKRKAFIHQAAVILKPLGFKKKANLWVRMLNQEYYVMFDMQKSRFSDEYYFNIFIGQKENRILGNCFYTRVAPDNRYPLDWQTISREEFDCFLKQTVVPMLETIIQTPLCELGKLEFVWKGCECSRKKCKQCWVEKNMWE